MNHPTPNQAVVEASEAADSAIAQAQTTGKAGDGTPQAPVVFVKPPFLSAPKTPTQTGKWGVRFDFNDGVRVVLPKKGKWSVRLRDYEADITLFQSSVMESGAASSTKRYFVPFEFEVTNEVTNEVFHHRMDLKDRPVLVQFPVGTLGDLMGWFPYAAKFEKVHGCRLTVTMAQNLIELFGPMYPSIEFRTPEEVNVEAFYATYRIGLFFDDWQNHHQPSDFRLVGLHRTAGYILGVDPTEEPPLLHLPDDSRPIAEPYVVIATQSTTQAKYWNHASGWREIIKFLKAHGYRVICIDRNAEHGQGVMVNRIPHGCEDETGDRPLAERARWMKHAEFFIGLSSGLSWLAWATGVPVVMISGFTHPTNEFHTPYRIASYHTCNSCWNDPKVMFSNSDFMWCPRKANTPQQFECTRSITPQQVMNAIKRIPSFARRAADKPMA
ncbi:autotransporter strand-loop-strand O-heptosyltransferase [Paraburkholderia sp. SIMBA_054]|uniref:autotransporter strand-loop-strand O-heptosyltransferase n=1 Tax=Paraburkholderia sp. SIMBA_054 TaxID=3085795 RepID=UPI00397B4760